MYPREREEEYESLGCFPSDPCKPSSYSRTQHRTSRRSASHSGDTPRTVIGVGTIVSLESRALGSPEYPQANDLLALMYGSRCQRLKVWDLCVGVVLQGLCGSRVYRVLVGGEGIGTGA